MAAAATMLGGETTKRSVSQSATLNLANGMKYSTYMYTQYMNAHMNGFVIDKDAADVIQGIFESNFEHCHFEEVIILRIH